MGRQIGRHYSHVQNTKCLCRYLAIFRNTYKTHNQKYPPYMYKHAVCPMIATVFEDNSTDDLNDDRTNGRQTR
jgi:hypothetical protein